MQVDFKNPMKYAKGGPQHLFWKPIHPTQDEEDHQLCDALKFAADCGNHWFRELYRFGVWIPGAESEQLSDAAYGLTET